MQTMRNKAALPFSL